MTDMLILIAHGSRDARWRASAARVVDALAALDGTGDAGVRLAYMDHTPPTLRDVAADAVAAGSRRLRVLPLFLAAEGHVERDVHPLVDEVRTLWTEIDVELLPPLGQHPEFIEALGHIARRTAEP